MAKHHSNDFVSVGHEPDNRRPQAAVATLWRALATGLMDAKNLAATKALRSRAESFSPPSGAETECSASLLSKRLWAKALGYDV